jgi:hypothetical protein
VLWISKLPKQIGNERLEKWLGRQSIVRGYNEKISAKFKHQSMQKASNEKRI